jgi:hypothetical protein
MPFLTEFAGLPGEQGPCWPGGTCPVRVLDGVVEHRDRVVLDL